MAIIKEKPIRKAYVWFDEELIENVDVRYCFYRSAPPEKLPYKEFHTIMLDITEDEDTLWNKFHKNNKYKIKRASERDNLICRFWEPHNIEPLALNEFHRFYNEFASERGLTKLKYHHLELLVARELLALSCVISEKGDCLVWHGYYQNHKIASLFYSSSTNNKEVSSSLLGRANRYLHWQDILKFKEIGITSYDFCGWYTGESDNKLLAINQFKEEFGGSIIKKYNFNEAMTLQGKIYLLGLDFYQKFQEVKFR